MWPSNGRTFYSRELSGLKMILLVETLLAWSRYSFWKLIVRRIGQIMQEDVSFLVGEIENQQGILNSWAARIKVGEGIWNVSPNWGNKANSSSNSWSDCFWYLVIFSLFYLIHIYMYMKCYSLMPWGELCILSFNLQFDNGLEMKEKILNNNNIIKWMVFQRDVLRDHR